MYSIETKRAYFTLTRTDILSNEQIEEIINNDELVDYIMTQSNNKTFKSIMEKLNYPTDIINERNNLTEKSLKNINRIEDINKRKEMIFELLLNDSALNIRLYIETIFERAYGNIEFKKAIDPETLTYLAKIHTFIVSENTNNEQVEDFIDFLKSNQSLTDLISKTFEFTKRDFERELRDKMEAVNITDGINANIIEHEGTPVEYYHLEGQTEAQRDFVLLTRTAYLEDFLLRENAMDELTRKTKSYKYLSYSLIRAEIFKSFSAKNRIRFGYTRIPTDMLLSANTYDGQTNQYTIPSDDFYIQKQQYLNVDEFLETTDSYNEIVLKTDEELKPSFIVVQDDEEITDEIIQVAANLNIPILFLDGAYYKKHIAVNEVPEKVRMETWFKHEQTLPINLNELSRESQRLD